MNDAITPIRLCGLCKLRPRLSVASRSLCAVCKAAALETKRVGNAERNRVAYAAARVPPRSAHPISLAAVVTRRLRLRGVEERFDAFIAYRGHHVPLLDDPVAGESEALREVERLAARCASFGEFVEARYQRHRHGFAAPHHHPED